MNGPTKICRSCRFFAPVGLEGGDCRLRPAPIRKLPLEWCGEWLPLVGGERFGGVRSADKAPAPGAQEGNLSTLLDPPPATVSGERVTETPETFGGRVKAARLRRGLSVQSLAELSGLSTSAIHRWEKGGIAGQRPLRTTVIALARGLDVRELWLTGGDRDE